VRARARDRRGAPYQSRDEILKCLAGHIRQPRQRPSRPDRDCQRVLDQPVPGRRIACSSKIAQRSSSLPHHPRNGLPPRGGFSPAARQRRTFLRGWMRRGESSSGSPRDHGPHMGFTLHAYVRTTPNDDALLPSAGCSTRTAGRCTRGARPRDDDLTGHVSDELGAEHMRSRVPSSASGKKMFPPFRREAGWDCSTTKEDYKHPKPGTGVGMSRRRNAHWKHRTRRPAVLSAVFNSLQDEACEPRVPHAPAQAVHDRECACGVSPGHAGGGRRTGRSINLPGLTEAEPDGGKFSRAEKERTHEDTIVFYYADTVSGHAAHQALALRLRPARAALVYQLPDNSRRCVRGIPGGAGKSVPSS